MRALHAPAAPAAFVCDTAVWWVYCDSNNDTCITKRGATRVARHATHPPADVYFLSTTAWYGGTSQCVGTLILRVAFVTFDPVPLDAMQLVQVV